jgi:type I restriction enzyme S subunit
MAQSLYREWFVKFRFPGHKGCQFKDSSLGRIPEGWEVSKLFDISSPTYGFAFKSRLFSEDGGGEKIVRIRDVPNNNSKTYTLEKPKKGEQILKNGDLLIGMDGDFHMGKWSGGYAYLCQRVVKITPMDGLSPYFVFLSFQKPIRELNKSIVGTTVAHLGDKHLKEIEVVFPGAELFEKFSGTVDPIFLEELNLRLKNTNLNKQRDMLLPKLISGRIKL